ncbi:rhombosortase [Vibrio salinus]|uniref:rhombosortase n=1 Tax=Vibrio salinus TaxID=2899784 RepID=UPI001E4981EE|nr:rhombosortase [Vibrio salinus]MCE0494645.1 rhombosortase [Vibrio salinus]
MNLYSILTLLSIPSVIALFEPATSFFVWDKTSISTGQWWRILTGNFAHTNPEHCIMNLAALWLIALIFRPSACHYFAITILISLGVGFGLMFTSLQQYVGLSGTLHGVFMYLALQEYLHGHRHSWILVAGVTAKVIWEQLMGPATYTQELIQAPVAIQAHLTGLIWGTILSLSYHTYNRFRKKK